MDGLDGLAQALGITDRKDADWHVLAKVSAVNPDGSLTVYMAGSLNPTTVDAYCDAQAGDVVCVLISKGKARAIARKGGTLADDYIVEIGETDGWNWEKWESGRAVAWATKTHARVCNQQYGNAWYSDQCQDTFPPGLFTQIDACLLSADSSGPGYAIETGSGVTVEHTQVYWLFRCEGSGGNFTAYIHILVKGRWK